MRRAIKKSIACFISVMLISLVPLYAFANDSRPSGFNKNYTLTGDPVSDIVAVAIAQIGRKQSEFGYTEAWCDNFVSDCAILVGQASAIPQGGTAHNFFSNLVNAGATKVSSPQAGDVVLFDYDSDGVYNHAALMIDSTNCINGNFWTSGYSQVEKWTYSTITNYNGGYCCFYRPSYKVNTNTKTLDVNVCVDGTLYTNGYDGVTFDVTLNGSTDSHGVEDYYKDVNNGTTWSVTNVKIPTNYVLTGSLDYYGNFSGTVKSDTFVEIGLTTPTLVSTKTLDGNKYEFYKVNTSWASANNFAKAKGGHLATITSQTEQEFIASNKPVNRCWLGGTDRYNEGVWEWTTGEAFGYTNWSIDQPSNGMYCADGEDFLELLGDGTWNDISWYHSEVSGFIVEYDHTHIWNSGVITKAATTEETGTITYTCTSCNSTKEETIPKLTDPNSVTYYRYRTKSTTTSTKSSLDGWTPTGNNKTETTYGSWGGWSAWIPGSKAATDTCEVKTATVYGYCYYECQNCHAHMHLSTGCYTWAGGCGRTGAGGVWHELWSPMSWDSAGLQDWYGTGKYYCYIDGQIWFKWSNSDGTPRDGYLYRTRSKTVTTTYEFEKWSDWSGWSTTPVTASETVEVQTRVETNSSSTLLFGDYTQDGKVAVGDAAAYYQYVQGKDVSVSNLQFLIGDVDADGCITQSDIDLIYQLVRGEILQSDLPAYQKFSIKLNDAKTVYEYGEAFDYDSLSICIDYGNGVSYIIDTTDADLLVTGYNPDQCGNQTLICNFYNNTVSFNVTVNHPWNNGVVTKEANCVETGVKKYTCTKCNITKIETLSINNSNHKSIKTDVSVSATCTTTGLTQGSHCSACGEIIKSQTVIEKKGHDIVNHSAKAATCTEKGWNAYQTCTRCEYSTYSETNAKGHDTVNHSAKAATCTEKGWNAYQTCTLCEYSTYSETNAKGHDIVNHSAKAATCTEKGWNAYQTCTRCEYSTYSETNAKGHDTVNHSAKAATCTEKGWNAYQTCTRCEYSTYSETNAKGHDIVNHSAKAATCTEKGWNAYQTCSRCNYTTYSETVPTGHQAGGWIIDETSTCSSKGIRHKECSVCHTILEYGEMDTLDHHDSDGDGRCDDCGTSISGNCSHLCHKTGFIGFIWKIINLFNKLFKINQYCSCGARHW